MYASAQIFFSFMVSSGRFELKVFLLIDLQNRIEVIINILSYREVTVGVDLENVNITESIPDA